jgi:hypothetical protein
VSPTSHSDRAAEGAPDVRVPGSDCGAQQREETIDRIGFSLML